MALKHLTQKVAQELDKELMTATQGGFSVDQLMELAGLSVAQAITKVYQNSTHPRLLICCGPGNNGGDGLVAARHLTHFGYNPAIYCPKPSKKDLFNNLITQCKNLNIPFIEDLEAQVQNSDLIVDAIFGFSFAGEVRDPFKQVIQIFSSTKLPVVAVDIPSGWQSEYQPEMLVSLTAPKLAAKRFRGKYHYLGGRFIPKDFAEKYGLKLPQYPGTDQCVDITNLSNL
ncbi:YjeF N-terminal domain-like protein [Basidiobolus meristosporus CBS 931.73]|uniref:NAD(P)H-hydrate epimerase n=1 Tax=Basidiobolus meristosporus CBS 931.73 TaxID=1314790 RepID=A0A1Y1XUH1_9FUNG|nr:YjeF N-terminal domain-like protein [Basidiobolus meristosporus CBS 931.73]|eukprot:ORX89417.1 YjeF N-terminal domain-like protein [Basidiobolus meristosporus CBS 931.73]